LKEAKNPTRLLVTLAGGVPVASPGLPLFPETKKDFPFQMNEIIHHDEFSHLPFK
jgi:hypothetical protein